MPDRGDPRNRWLLRSSLPLYLWPPSSPRAMSKLGWGVGKSVRGLLEALAPVYRDPAPALEDPEEEWSNRLSSAPAAN